MKEAVVNIGYCPLDEKCETVTAEDGQLIIFDTFCPIYGAAKRSLEKQRYKRETEIVPFYKEPLNSPFFEGRQSAFRGKGNKRGMAILDLSKLKTTHTCCCRAYVGSPKEREETQNILDAMVSARDSILEEVGRTAKGSVTIIH